MDSQIMNNGTFFENVGCVELVVNSNNYLDDYIIANPYC